MESLLEFLIQGVVLGGLYALFAVGLSLIFGVLDVINVAHGEFFAVGGYLAFAAVVLLHLPGAAGVLGAAVGTFLLGLCVYPLLIAPLKRRVGGPPQGPLYVPPAEPPRARGGRLPARAAPGERHPRPGRHRGEPPAPARAGRGGRA